MYSDELVWLPISEYCNLIRLRLLTACQHEACALGEGRAIGSRGSEVQSGSLEFSKLGSLFRVLFLYRCLPSFGLLKKGVLLGFRVVLNQDLGSRTEGSGLRVINPKGPKPQTRLEGLKKLLLSTFVTGLAVVDWEVWVLVAYNFTFLS